MSRRAVLTIDEIHKKVVTMRSDPSTVGLGVDGLDLKSALLIQYSKTILDQLDVILKSGDRNPVDKLQIFLAKNWEDINGTMLCYTALPQHDITKLLCDIAYFVADKKPSVAINMLMPGLCTDHFQNAEKNLVNFDLNEVLQTHILGEGGRYLIPVEMLTAVTLSSNLGKQHNPYYDVSEHPDSDVFVKETELARLSEHSADADTIINLKKQYEALTKESDNLLNRLNTLIRLMVFNSSHGGIGTADVAAKGGMIAVADFFEYYDTLDSRVKKTIPGAVEKEIELLRSFGEPTPKKNIHGKPVLNAQGKPVFTNTDAASCLGTRSADLKKAITGHETTLLGIELTGDQKNNQAKVLEEKFQHAVGYLKKQLEEKRYDGTDHLGVTKKIIELFEIPFHLRSYDDLAIFKHLSCDEIKEILTLESAADEIARTIYTIENLVIFIIETNPEKLAIILPAIVKKLIHSWQDFSATLMSLDSEKINVVCTACKDHLLIIIKTTANFFSVMRSLNAEQCTAVCIACKDVLPTIIQTATDFNRVIHNLNAEQCAAVCIACQDHLPTIIKTANDFYNVIRELNAEQRTAVCIACQNLLPKIIKTKVDFGSVMRYLNAEQRTAVYLACKNLLPKIIETATDFGGVMHYLNAEQRTAVCIACKDHLPTIIKTATDFYNVIRDLNPEQRTAVYLACKELLPEIIKTITDFVSVMRCLNAEQCTAVCIACQDHLPTIIKTITDFSNAMDNLNAEQRTAVCIACQDHLPTIIKTITDFSNAMGNLNAEQRTAVCIACKDHLPAIIKTATDFCNVMFYLNAEQCAVVYLACKDLLPKLIETATDFDGVMRCLNAEQRTAVYLACKELLPKLIKTATDFGSVMYYLNPEQREAIKHVYFSLAVKQFFENDDAKKESYWNTEEIKTITLEDIVDHASGKNNLRDGVCFSFFSKTYTGENTKKQLMSLFSVTEKEINGREYRSIAVKLVNHRAAPSPGPSLHS